MNEQQKQLIETSTVEEIKDAIDWADEVLETWESLLDLFSEPVIGEILSELPSTKNLMKFLDEFRKSRNQVVEAYIKKKELTSNERNASE